MNHHEPMTPEQLNAMSTLALAHVGDAVYELLVRGALAHRGELTNGRLHTKTVAFVSAGAQAEAALLIAPHLTDEERRIYNRGRNCRVHGVPGGCSPAQYHAATALEALFGRLWLSGNARRAAELFSYILEGCHAS